MSCAQPQGFVRAWKDNCHYTLYHPLKAVIQEPVIYAILNDYRRTVEQDNPKTVVGLNCDTAVRSSLDGKQKIHRLSNIAADGSWPMDWTGRGPTYYEGFQRRLFDITEDQSINDIKVKDVRKLDDLTPLLHSPLPRHLPHLKRKDLLIYVAAAEGNIERYARLRRPFCEDRREEIAALVRGIYHHAFFAKWCASQPDFLLVLAIQKAITARYIMSGDVSRITTDSSVYQIWYPVQADYHTYHEVLRRCPSMRQAVARAAVVINSATLFKEADPDPSDRRLGLEAQASRNPWFLEDLQRRAAEQGKEIDIEARESTLDRPHVRDVIRESFNITHAPKDLNEIEPFKFAGWFGDYDGYDFDVAPAAATAIASEEVKSHPRFKKAGHFDQRYLFQDGPYSEFDDWELPASDASVDSDPEPIRDLFD
ncbi:hypothetical protein KVT40_006398 [Elsinoe batatas]|uniref:Uncharacterized protein n=1 Tax=Elsinoe batatas TaxID=2601811 RepID=A0A8K0PEW6_9PEZI|nr:hypothetical protein KVT40_006398 [Elsinoe batatas]